RHERRAGAPDPVRSEVRFLTYVGLCPTPRLWSLAGPTGPPPLPPRAQTRPATMQAGPPRNEACQCAGRAARPRALGPPSRMQQRDSSAVGNGRRPERRQARPDVVGARALGLALEELAVEGSRCDGLADLLVAGAESQERVELARLALRRL